MPKCWLQHRVQECVLLFFLLTAGCAGAQPAQRVIVDFAHALTSTEQDSMHQRLGELLTGEYQLAGHSGANRWILILRPPISQKALLNFIEQVSKFDSVRNVEVDKLMKPARTLNRTP